MDPDSSRLRVTVTDGRGRPVPDEGLAKWLTAVSPARAGGEVAIALVSDRRIRQLNRQYRRKDTPTDVLSFAVETDPEPSARSIARRPNTRTRAHPNSRSSEPPFLGDIVIAHGVARRQAREAGHSFASELRILALHGLLHLLGYDHERDEDRQRMARVEARLRRRGGLRHGLIGRAMAATGLSRQRRRGARPK